jgi:hypothetical protein
MAGEVEHGWCCCGTAISCGDPSTWHTNHVQYLSLDISGLSGDAGYGCGLCSGLHGTRTLESWHDPIGTNVPTWAVVDSGIEYRVTMQCDSATGFRFFVQLLKVGCSFPSWESEIFPDPVDLSSLSTSSFTVKSSGACDTSGGALTLAAA